jgi:hypothetical protein
MLIKSTAWLSTSFIEHMLKRPVVAGEGVLREGPTRISEVPYVKKVKSKK